MAIDDKLIKLAKSVEFGGQTCIWVATPGGVLAGNLIAQQIFWGNVNGDWEDSPFEDEEVSGDQNPYEYLHLFKARGLMGSSTGALPDMGEWAWLGQARVRIEDISAWGFVGEREYKDGRAIITRWA